MEANKIIEGYYYNLDGLKNVKVIWKKYDKANVLVAGTEYPTAIVDIDRLQGIELTEEILLKCKLFKNNGYPFKFLDGFIKIRNGVYFFQYHKLDIELKYLHQFQNLAHSLNNKELEINF